MHRGLICRLCRAADRAAGLDDGRRNENVNVAADEVIHNLLELALAHLSMRKTDPCFRYKLAEPARHKRDIIHLVINIVDLPFARKLAQNRFPHHLLVVFHNIGLDRHAVLRRFFEDTHVPDAGQAHVQRSWNRCRGQCQNIDTRTELLDFLLGSHAEALLS